MQQILKNRHEWKLLFVIILEIRKIKASKKKYVFNLSNASITGAGDSRHVSDS